MKLPTSQTLSPGAYRTIMLVTAVIIFVAAVSPLNIWLKVAVGVLGMVVMLRVSLPAPRRR